MNISIEDFRNKEKKIAAFNALFAKHEHLIVYEDMREGTRKEIALLIMDLDLRLSHQMDCHYLYSDKYTDEKEVLYPSWNFFFEDTKDFILAFTSEYYVGFKVFFRPNRFNSKYTDIVLTW